MIKKLFGILTLTSVALLLLVVILLWVSGEHFRASNVQLSIALLITSVGFVGMYLLQNYCPKTPTSRKLLIGALGVIFIVFGALVSFNSIDFNTSYNWLIALGILYILLVQLQLLNWGKESNVFAKICAYILILCNGSLFIFYIIQPRFYALSLWINIIIITSIVSFFIGVIVSKQPQQEEITVAD